VDLCSKRGYATPLRAKTAEEVVRGLGLLMFGSQRQFVVGPQGRITVRHRSTGGAPRPQMARLPRTLRSDNGPEFKNALVTAFLQGHALVGGRPVKQVFGLPCKPQSNGQVERFNSIVKRQLKMITVQHGGGGKSWAALLPTVLANYNSSWSRIIKSTPDAVERAYLATGDATEARDNIRRAVVARNQRPSALAARLFQVGDLVRVKLDWDKAAGLAWSRDLYAVAAVRTRAYGPQYRHTQYRLIDEHAEPVPGLFYNDQLQRVEGLQTTVAGPAKYIVQRLVKPLVREARAVYQVKWQGYRAHTFEPRADLLRDVPHLVHRFERRHSVRWPSEAAVRRGAQPTYTP